MKIIKLEHSGLAIEKANQTILIDPVEFTEKLPTHLFGEVVAIIITHKHDDHCQPATISNLLSTNPSATVFTAPDATPLISGSIVVKGGETREVSNFKIQFFGQSHASILEGQIPCDNLGVVIDDVFVDPGDSFDKPPIEHPKVLCVPISAPWAKISDAAKYIKDTKPEIVIPVHDSVLSNLGKTYNNSWLKFFCDPLGIQFTPLTPSSSIEIV